MATVALTIMMMMMILLASVKCSIYEKRSVRKPI